MFHRIGSKGKQLPLRGRLSLSKTEVLILLVSRLEADPIARSHKVLSKFIDEALQGTGYDWKPSPAALLRELQRWSASERGANAAGNDSRVPPVEDGEVLP